MTSTKDQQFFYMPSIIIPTSADQVVSENGILDPNLIVPSSDTLGGEVEDHKIQIISQAVSNPMLLNATPVYNDRE